MIWALLVLVGFWPIAILMGHTVHFALHSPKLGRFYRSHLAHHKIYPVTDFVSDQYREVGKDSTVWPFLSLGIALAILGAIFTPWWFWIPAALDLAILGWIHDFYHGQIHLTIPTTRIARSKWFVEIKELHRLHHKNVRTNYGIVYFGFDKLFGTFRSK